MDELSFAVLATISVQKTGLDILASGNWNNFFFVPVCHGTHNYRTPRKSLQIKVVFNFFVHAQNSQKMIFTGLLQT